MTQTLLAFIVMTLTACSAFQVTEKSDTLGKQLAVAQITLDGVRTAHTNLVTTGRINSASLDKEITEQEDSVERIMNATRAALKSGDLTTAQGQLQIMNQAMALLTVRIAELQAQKEGEGK